LAVRVFHPALRKPKRADAQCAPLHYVGVYFGAAHTYWVLCSYVGSPADKPKVSIKQKGG